VNEYNSIEQAAININEGGRITSMVIGVPRPNGESIPLMPSQVVTTYMVAPEAMYNAILGLFRDRQREIEDDLRDMGITGALER
jgi:hypothetical protein